MSEEYIETVLRDLHLAEMKRKDTVNGMIAVPIAVVTVLCGVISYYVQRCPDVEFDPFDCDFFLTWFVLSLSLLFVAVAVAIAFLILSIHGFKYRYLSEPDDLRAYIDGMKAHYEVVHEDKPKRIMRSVAAELRELLGKQYLECAKTNRRTNIVKANRLYFANTAIITALVILGQSLIPFHVTMNRYERTQKVEVVGVNLDGQSP